MEDRHGYGQGICLGFNAPVKANIGRSVVRTMQTTTLTLNHTCLIFMNANTFTAVTKAQIIKALAIFAPYAGEGIKFTMTPIDMTSTMEVKQPPPINDKQFEKIFIMLSFLNVPLIIPYNN